MTRFALASVVGSMRQVFAIVIAVLAIAGTAYLVSNRLSNPDHYQPYGGGVCADQVYIMSPVQGGRPCRPPTRATWQVPLAVAIAILGLGAAVKVDAAPGVTFAMAT